MPNVFAFDYDGTIASNGRIHEPMIAALEAARLEGFPLVLVTGRFFSHLLRECPNAMALFDRVVCENGAVLARPGGSPQPLAEPVDQALDEALQRQGIDVLRGQVIVALEARHEEAVRQAAAGLKLEVRLVRNRAALMVMPPEISKATGLSHALASLGVGFGEAISFGDAQNDLEMLASSALGVAVADSVDELKMSADVVLQEPGPDAVAEFILGLVKAERSGREDRERKGRGPAGS